MHAAATIPPLEKRVDALLENARFDAFVASTRASVLYLSGVDYNIIPYVTEERAFVVWVADGRRMLIAPGWGPEYARESSRLEVRLWSFPATPISTLIALLRELGLESATVGIEAEVLPTAVADSLRAALPAVELRSVDRDLLRLRIQKTPEEISLIRTACRAAEYGMIEAIEGAREGITERDFAKQLSDAVLANGGERIPWLALRWGDSEQRLTPGDRPIKQGELINIELGCEVSGYLADVQRMVGVPPIDPAAGHAYGQLTGVLRRTLLRMRPGMTTGTVYREFLDDMKASGIEQWEGYHLGHSLGLEPHEDYWIGDQGDADVIPDQSVFACEPTILAPTVLAVEDTVLVAEDGNEILSSTGEWSELAILGERVSAPA